MIQSEQINGGIIALGLAIFLRHTVLREIS